MAANVNNYIRAGNAGVRSAVQTRKALADNKARLDEIGMEAVSQDAKNRVNTAKNNSRTAQTAIYAKRDLANTKTDIETDKKIAGIKKGARKAGMLAGGVAMLGAGAMRMNRKDEPDEMLSHYDKLRGKLEGQISDQDGKISEAQAYADSFKDGGANASKLNPDSTDKPDVDTAPVPQGEVNTNTAAGSTASPDFKGFVEMARSAGAKHPQLVAAQWALESGWGKTPSGKNNFFGIKASSGEGGTSKGTWEVINGQEVNTTARFKDFDSPQSAVSELVNKWHKDFDGYSGVNRAGSAHEAAGLLVQEGYATDPKYAEKLRKIMADQGY